MSKPFRDFRYRLFYGLLPHRHVKMITLPAPGAFCSWAICPEGLDSKSIVYSGGVGSDITFEHALARQFGCQIVLYDPSPTGLQTMTLAENRIPQFRFFPVALAAHRGTLKMEPPPILGDDSWCPSHSASATLEVPCIDLRSFMEQNGHTHIDLLKMDIEGSEYEVIDDMLKRRIAVRQVCVEYHHGILPDCRRAQTIRSMLKLAARGYKLICQDGSNHTFILP